MTRTTDLELPEEIDLQLEVANVGSRTLAVLADLGICGVVLLAAYVASSLLGRAADRADSRHLWISMGLL